MPSALMMRSRLNSLERQMMDFAKDHHFMNLYSRLEAKEKEAASFRNQNYPYFKEELENMLVALKQRVDSNSHELGRQLVMIGTNLSAELRQASFFVGIANQDEVDDALLEMAEREIQDFERKFRQSKEHYFALIDPNFEEKMRAIDKLLKRIPYYLQMREEASFEFAANEQVVMADKAEWVVSGKGKEDPDGIFFLTNQRICFEQKETTGKFLGMFGGQKQQGLQWEYPLGQIESVSHKDEGMLKGKDMLTLVMKAGASHSSIALEVKGDDDNEVWHRMIEQIRQSKSGTYIKEINKILNKKSPVRGGREMEDQHLDWAEKEILEPLALLGPEAIEDLVTVFKSPKQLRHMSDYYACQQLYLSLVRMGRKFADAKDEIIATLEKLVKDAELDKSITMDSVMKRQILFEAELLRKYQN